MTKKKKKQKIDMGWGSPTFLSSYWNNKSLSKIQNEPTTKDYLYGSRDSLKSKIKKLHKKVKNANVKDKHIVVAAGATQILLGILYLLGEDSYKTSAYAEKPYFSRFPILANYALLDWLKKDSAVYIVTNPNNPDGDIRDHTKADILDLCYNWPQYTTPVNYDHPVMVFSLSKTTGHANTRIGWAVLKDEDLAKKLERFIEFSTGGLSLEAQIKAEQVIETQLKVKDTVFKYGKLILDARWGRINKLKHTFPFEVLNNSGMFLWAKGKCPKEILSLSGELLGASDDFFRLNIGCSQSNFNKFLKLVTEK